MFFIFTKVCVAYKDTEVLKIRFYDWFYCTSRMYSCTQCTWCEFSYKLLLVNDFV
jgi:hypothetical protein